MAFIFSKSQSIKEKTISDLEIIISKNKTSIDYLQTILMEVEELIVIFHNKKKHFFEQDSLHYLKFNTSYWEVLKTSGEIPSLFNPQVLHILTNFYTDLALANTLYEQFITSEMNRSGNVETMLWRELTQTLHTIDNVISTSNLEQILNQEIESSKKKLLQKEEELSKIKNETLLKLLFHKK